MKPKTAKQYLNGFHTWVRKNLKPPFTGKQYDAAKVDYMQWVIDDVARKVKEGRR